MKIDLNTMIRQSKNLYIFFLWRTVYFSILSISRTCSISGLGFFCTTYFDLYSYYWLWRLCINSIHLLDWRNIEISSWYAPNISEFIKNENLTNVLSDIIVKNFQSRQIFLQIKMSPLLHLWGNRMMKRTFAFHFFRSQTIRWKT